MPIQNGYEACKNIINVFNDRKLFKLKKNKKGQSRELIAKPVMIAASSLVNDDVVRDCEKVGFVLTLSIPITPEMIMDLLLPLI